MSNKLKIIAAAVMLVMVTTAAVISEASTTSSESARIKSTETKKTTTHPAKKTKALKTAEKAPEVPATPQPAPVDPNGCEAKGMYWRADNYECLPRPTQAPAAIQQSAPQVLAAAPASSVPSGSVWDRLAMCESTGNWAYDGGSGFDGGIQFLPSTWAAMNTGYAYAWQAPREVQIAAGIKLQAQAGWGQWPACAAKLGLL